MLERKNRFKSMIKSAVMHICYYPIKLYTVFLQHKYRISFYSESDTMARVLDGGSISRIGDGEFDIMLDRGKHRFQDNNTGLRNRLIEIMRIDMRNTPGYYVALSPTIGTYKGFTRRNVHAWVAFNLTRLKSIYGLSNNEKKYYDAYAFRIRGIKKEDDTSVINRINSIKELWIGKKVLIVEGDMKTLCDLNENSCLGVGSDLLSEADSIERIIAPSTNAFSKYNEILNSVCKNFHHDLVIIVLGMTATVLAYDLYKRGIRAIDFGQSNKDYLAMFEFNDNVLSYEMWESQIIERV